MTQHYGPPDYERRECLTCGVEVEYDFGTQSSACHCDTRCHNCGQDVPWQRWDWHPPLCDTCIPLEADGYYQDVILAARVRTLALIALGTIDEALRAHRVKPKLTDLPSELEEALNDYRTEYYRAIKMDWDGDVATERDT